MVYSRTLTHIYSPSTLKQCTSHTDKMSYKGNGSDHEGRVLTYVRNSRIDASRVHHGSMRGYKLRRALDYFLVRPLRIHPWLQVVLLLIPEVSSWLQLFHHWVIGTTTFCELIASRELCGCACLFQFTNHCIPSSPFFPIQYETIIRQGVRGLEVELSFDPFSGGCDS